MFKRNASNTEKPAPTPLQIPEIALSIIDHLDPPTILIFRRVSFRINALISQRHFLTTISCHPPEIDGLRENFHLKTLVRIPKAYELAGRANRYCDCYVEAGREGRLGEEFPIMKPGPLYSAFLARCTRAILIIWTLNDIRRHLNPIKPLPILTFIPSGCQQRIGWRLLSRISPSFSAPLTVDYLNDQAISLYLDTLVTQSQSEFQRYSSAFDAARQAYLNSLSREHLIDLVWVQSYLFIGLARNDQGRSGYWSTDVEMAFALQQKPDFVLSLGSRVRCERDLAWKLVRRVAHAKKSEFSIDELGNIVPFFPMDDSLYIEAKKAKEELTIGDWRHVGSIRNDAGTMV